MLGLQGRQPGQTLEQELGVRFKAKFRGLWGGSGAVSLPDSPSPGNWALAHGERRWGDSELQSMIINSMITNERERGGRKNTVGLMHQAWLWDVWLGVALGSSGQEQLSGRRGERGMW